MADIKVSVLVPAYNREMLLAEAVDSIQNQTHKNLDIIIYDDGSSDGTVHVANALARRDARIRVRATTANCGVGEIRNLLLGECKTRYACWQDSDDISHRQRIEILLGELLKYETSIIRSLAPWYSSDKVEQFHQAEFTGEVPYYDNWRACMASALFDCKNVPRLDADLTDNGEDIDWLNRICEMNAGSGNPYELHPHIAVGGTLPHLYGEKAIVRWPLYMRRMKTFNSAGKLRRHAQYEGMVSYDGRL